MAIRRSTADRKEFGCIEKCSSLLDLPTSCTGIPAAGYLNVHNQTI